MRPTASTWPWTKCPPKRPSARRGRSRFTTLSRLTVPKRNPGGADRVRRDVKPHEIHDLFSPCGGMQPGAAFEQERSNLERPQFLESAADTSVARNPDLRPACLERIPKLACSGS